MKDKRLIISLLVMSVLTLAYATLAPDSRRGAEGWSSLFSGKSGSSVVTEPVVPRPVVKPVVSELAETDTVAYYMNVVKQHGWIRGLGTPITKEHASHLASYYRLSDKNASGHWTRIESFNGYGKPVNGSMATYLTQSGLDSDSLMDPIWKERLGTVVRWELLGDPTGKRCVRENAYDRDGVLVYGYLLVPVGENTAMGHYVDCYGRTARIRGDQASYVLIHYDKNGYEERIDYLGDGGFPKRNMWNSYASVYEYDKGGFQRSNLSCAPDGTYMYDRSTNCGQTGRYDRYGNSIEVYNVDIDGSRMRVSENSDEKDFIGYRGTYDKWGRLTRMSYIDEKGRADTTSHGVHATVNVLDDHGNNIYWNFLDINGQLTDRTDGFATFEREYDAQGHLLRVTAKKSNGDLANAINNEFATEHLRWNGSDIVYNCIYLTTNGRDSVPDYLFRKEDNRDIMVYFDKNSINIVEHDSLGRCTSDSYFDLRMRPVCCRDGFHSKKNEYIDQPGKLTQIIQWYNPDGTLQNLTNRSDFNKQIIISDTTARVEQTQNYRDGIMSKRYVFACDETLSHVLGEIGLDVTGERARTHLETAMYYNAYTANKTDGNISYVGITNEYGEPAYCLTGDNPLLGVVFAFNPSSSEPYLDEEGQVVDDVILFKYTRNIAFVIEVFDPRAHDLGIHSGDVIMAYDRFAYPEIHKRISINDIDDHLLLATLDSRDRSKTMTVMRRDPLTNTPEVLNIELPEGMPGDFGFFWHKFPYTPKETSRYEQAFSTHFGEQAVPSGFADDEFGELSVSRLQPYRCEGVKNEAFSQGMLNDCLMLGCVVWDADSVKHVFTDYDSVVEFDDPVALRLWYTTDLHTVDSLEVVKDDMLSLNIDVDSGDTTLLRSLVDDYLRLQGEAMAMAEEAEYPKSETAASKSGYSPDIDFLIAQVEDEGWMNENGIDGYILILKWNDWDCYDSISDFVSKYGDFNGEEQHIIYMDLTDAPSYDRIHEITIPAQTADGLNFYSNQATKDDFETVVRYPYYQWQYSRGVNLFPHIDFAP